MCCRDIFVSFWRCRGSRSDMQVVCIRASKQAGVLHERCAWMQVPQTYIASDLSSTSGTRKQSSGNTAGDFCDRRGSCKPCLARSLVEPDGQALLSTWDSLGLFTDRFSLELANRSGRNRNLVSRSSSIPAALKSELAVPLSSCTSLVCLLPPHHVVSTSRLLQSKDSM